MEEGFELHYNDCYYILSEDVLKEKEEECQEVIDILQMYRCITFSNKKGDYKLNPEDIKFNGFDSNSDKERKRVLYARYLINDLNKFNELKFNDKYADFNSHSQMLNIYREQLERWKSLNKHYDNLSKEEILTILNI